MGFVKMFLRLGICMVFLVSLVCGLSACQKEETPEPAQEAAREMTEVSEAAAPEVQGAVEEAKEEVMGMAEEAKEEVKEMVGEGKEEAEEVLEDIGVTTPEM